MKGPVLLHVVTTKGKGHPLAERNPRQYHGIAGRIIRRKWTV